MSGGVIRVSSGMKKTIQDIREIAGQHSDDDIYAMLKECSMDPNETIQRLLHLDVFHEVKKKNGRRKEIIENKASDYPGRQQHATASRGAKVDRGNFHFQNASQNNGRKFLGGGKENGYHKINTSKGESKSTAHTSRLDHVDGNGSDNHFKKKNTHVGTNVSDNGFAELKSAAENQQTDSVGIGEQDFASKDAVSEETDKHAEDSVSENDVSVVLEDSSKLNLSDGQHVVFPENLQVPEAYKTKLTFGSFDGIWATDAKQTNESNVVGSDSLIDVSCPASDSIIEKSSTENNEVILPNVEVAQQNEDPSYLPSPSAVSGSASHMTCNTVLDVVIKIDESETDKLMPNEVFEPSKSDNNEMGYTLQTDLQAHNSAEPQVGNFTASSTSSIVPTSANSPLGSSRDMVSTPPPAPTLRQTYHPNFVPYGNYYPQFFAPQIQQYMTHGGLPPPPSFVNPYLASSVAAGITYPHQQSKQETNAGTESYIGVPSGYSPYIPYAYPYGLPPVVIPGNRVADVNDHETKSKENATNHTTEQQMENSSEWITRGADRTVSAMQHVNPYYTFGLGQGQPMFFPPSLAAYGAFGGGVYHSSVQTIPAPQPAVNSQIHQPQSLLKPDEPSVAQSVTPPPSVFYHQQQQHPQGAHITWNNKQ